MSSSAGRLAKPQLRGHLNDALKRSLWEAGIAAFATGLAYKYLIAEPRKRRYAEFYRSVRSPPRRSPDSQPLFCFSTYDGQADGERMMKLGLFMGFQDITAENEPW